MVESSRLYPRKSLSIPVTFIPDDLPIVASHTDILPMSPMGLIEREAFGADMKNSSADGFCLVTEKKLQPGTEIEVKMVNFKPIPLGNAECPQCQARVVWCSPVGETENGKCYELGAKKIRKDGLPIMNWTNPDFASMKCV